MARGDMERRERQGESKGEKGDIEGKAEGKRVSINTISTGYFLSL